MEFHEVGIPKTKTSSSVAEQILDVIRSGTHEEGSKLPSERELARLMGVSRNSVREALSALHIAGFVQTRVGDGTYVSTQLRDPGRRLSLIYDDGVDLMGIWIARDEIERVLTQSALERATTADFDALDSILSDMEDAVGSGSVTKFSLCDVAFHLQIADVSDSFGLARAEQQLLGVVRQFYAALEQQGSARRPSHLEKSLGTHRAIARALQRRDPVSAASALSDHFMIVQDYLRDALVPQEHRVEHL